MSRVRVGVGGVYWTLCTGLASQHSHLLSSRYRDFRRNEPAGGFLFTCIVRRFSYLTEDTRDVHVPTAFCTPQSGNAVSFLATFTNSEV